MRQEFGRILEWVANGEEVAITKRRQAVARLLPAKRGKIARAKMPDVGARLRKVFGGKVLSDRVMKEILDENRGRY